MSSEQGDLVTIDYHATLSMDTNEPENFEIEYVPREVVNDWNVVGSIEAVSACEGGSRRLASLLYVYAYSTAGESKTKDWISTDVWIWYPYVVVAPHSKG